MLAKAVCVLLVGYTYYFMLVGPKTGKELPEMDDKLGKDGSYVVIHRTYRVTIAPLAIPLLTGAYLYLLARGIISLDLEGWQVTAMALHAIAFWLRSQAYAELGRFFTCKIAVRADHQLVTTGLYKHLRHPSYTGYMLGGICFHMIMLYHGLWDALVYPLTGIPLPAYVALAVFGVFYGSFVFPRIYYEEAMLKEHFGEEKWAEYASKRYRLIPSVY